MSTRISYLTVALVLVSLLVFLGMPKMPSIVVEHHTAPTAPSAPTSDVTPMPSVAPLTASNVAATSTPPVEDHEDTALSLLLTTRKRVRAVRHDAEDRRGVGRFGGSRRTAKVTLDGNEVCTLVPAESRSERRDTRSELAAALTAWGDYRTYLFTFDELLLRAAVVMHRALVDTVARDPSLRLNGVRWAEEAEREVQQQDDRSSLLLMSPSILLVPPSAARYDWLGFPLDHGDPLCATTQRATSRANTTRRSNATRSICWRARDPADAVVVLDPKSKEAVEFEAAHKRLKGKDALPYYTGYFSKSILMWDYVTRMMNFEGRVDGEAATGARDEAVLSLQSCAWFMKVDTDTFINRAAMDIELGRGAVPFNRDETWLFDPVESPAYAGLPFHISGVTEHEQFMFGGTGYSFTRGALAKIHESSTMAFRHCPFVVQAYRDKNFPGHLEDVLIGSCVAQWNDVGGVGMKFLWLTGRANGRVNRIHDVLLKRPSRCLCCLRTIHRVDGTTAKELSHVIAKYCLVQSNHTSARYLGASRRLMTPEQEAFCIESHHSCANVFVEDNPKDDENASLNSQPALSVDFPPLPVPTPNPPPPPTDAPVASSVAPPTTPPPTSPTASNATR